MSQLFLPVGDVPIVVGLACLFMTPKVGLADHLSLTTPVIEFTLLDWIGLDCPLNQFLEISFLVLLSCLLSCQGNERQETKQQSPNVLFIAIDDLLKLPRRLVR